MIDEKPSVVQKVDLETWPIAMALLLIFFWGDPDLCDALIHFLMGAKP